MSAPGKAERVYKRDRLGRFARRQYVPRGKRTVGGYPAERHRGHDIPLGADGRVPREMMAARLVAASPRPARDARRPARSVLRNPTPAEAAAWWDDPSLCDVAGVDDADELFRLAGLRDPRSQERIAVVAATEGDQRAIREALQDAFSSEELERMASGGLVIVADGEDPVLLGSCDFRTDNRPASMITISKDAVRDGETVVHEAVHQLRHAEGRSENRDPTGRTNTAKRAGRRTRAEAREERATEMETRDRLDRRPTLVLIDESGDPSHTPNSSREFVMVATIKEDDGQFERIADETPKYIRRSRRHGEKDELKYSSSSDEVREDVLKRIEATDARIHVVRVPKEGIGKSPERLYGNVTKEILKSTLSDEKVRGNPKGAKVILDDSRYASRLDVKKTIESAAEDRGVAVDEGSGTRRSHECKPLQVNDFPTGAYGTEYNAGDSKYSDIVRGKSIVRIFHRK